MSPMRRWLRPLWVFLALLFLLEAWLWDHLEPLVARVVNLIPWGRLKIWLAQLIRDLPPWATLIVFVIPFIVLLPLKFLEVYFPRQAAMACRRVWSRSSPSCSASASPPSCST